MFNVISSPIAEEWMIPALQWGGRFMILVQWNFMKQETNVFDDIDDFSMEVQWESMKIMQGIEFKQIGVNRIDGF